jgi:tetratricopeptide (TPR) repeat protein
MDSSWLKGLFLVCTVLFVIPFLKIAGTFGRLLFALVSGTVKWPGPVIHNPDPRVTLGRRRVGLKLDHLFSEFVFNVLGITASFTFFLLLYIGISYLSDQFQIRWSCSTVFIMIVLLIAGMMSSNKAILLKDRVNTLLSDISSGDEPHSIDGSSAEAEYAIAHPLLDQPSQTSEFSRALQLFCDGTTYFQSGNQAQALSFYQEAMEIDPNLHEDARTALAIMAQNPAPADAGSIYYWLGAHSEYLMDRIHAKFWYEKAAAAFHQIGYLKRESRARCNLGNVKMQSMDPTAMDEFEKAVALNPRNGTAYINIGNTYYRISERGDPRFDQALDAYANAIIADPIRFGPMVISRLREYGYTWKEDIEDITRRVEEKRRITANENP